MPSALNRYWHGWTLPDAERPDFLTLYFSAVDSAGHREWCAL